MTRLTFNKEPIDNGGLYAKHDVFVDGNLSKSFAIDGRLVGSQPGSFVLLSNDGWQEIKDVRLDELDDGIGAIEIIINAKADGSEFEVDTEKDGGKEFREVRIEGNKSFITFYKVEGKWSQTVVSIKFNLLKWKNPWSIEEFGDELDKYAQEIPDVFSRDEKRSSANYPQNVHLSLPVSSEHSTLLQEWELRSQEVKRLLVETENRLRASLSENTLVTPYTFHPALQGACEEYLWSFIQFLKDVGVEATGELKREKEHPRQVLFAVTPTRGKEALGKIKQALELYLSLAGASQFEFEQNASIQADRLESRILFFQSQLKSAQAEARLQLAEIRAHEATIQAQEVTIRTQGMALERVDATNVFLLARIDEMKEEKAKKAKDEREFFGGIIRLGHWNTKGFIVNIPRLLDQIKAVMIESNAPATTSVIVPELSSASRLPVLPPADTDRSSRL